METHLGASIKENSISKCLKTELKRYREDVQMYKVLTVTDSAYSYHPFGKQYFKKKHEKEFS